jgi:uncharacterized protein with HEPN domain
MQPEDRDEALIYDMLDAARHLWLMWQGRSIEELLADRTLQWATDRGFNIIGEAARRVSEATKTAHAEIAWRRIVGLRNIVVHNYDEVDYARHWHVIQHERPRLIEELEKIDL